MNTAISPFFSIIIPLYNKEKHIGNTLNSVFSQSFQDFEIIIINDGSTDDSLKKIKTIKDHRLKVFSTKNKGVASARNYGIQKSKSNLLVFLDSDDLWLNHHLQDLKELYEDFPNCGMYCKAYSKIKGNHTIKTSYKNIPRGKLWRGILDDYFESSLYNSIAWTSALMIPKSTINTLGFFDTNITLGAGEDIDLWIRIALNYSVAFYNKVSALHVLDSDNRISNSNTNLRRFINLDKYNSDANNNPSLKKYLDLNRYAIAIQYKMANNPNKAKIITKHLDLRSLTYKQRFLINQKESTLRFLKKIQLFLEQVGFNLSSH